MIKHLSSKLWLNEMIHPTAKVSQQIIESATLVTRFYNFQSSTPTLSPQTLDHRRWFHLANKLKTLRISEPPKFTRIWNSHRHHAARLLQTTQYDRLSQQQLD